MVRLTCMSSPTGSVNRRAGIDLKSLDRRVIGLRSWFRFRALNRNISLGPYASNDAASTQRKPLINTAVKRGCFSGKKCPPSPGWPCGFVAQRLAERGMVQVSRMRSSLHAIGHPLGRLNSHTARPALLPLLMHGNLRYRKIDEEGNNKRYR